MHARMCPTRAAKVAGAVLLLAMVFAAPVIARRALGIDIFGPVDGKCAFDSSPYTVALTESHDHHGKYCWTVRSSGTACQLGSGQCCGEALDTFVIRHIDPSCASTGHHHHEAATKTTTGNFTLGHEILATVKAGAFHGHHLFALETVLHVTLPAATHAQQLASSPKGAKICVTLEGRCSKLSQLVGSAKAGGSEEAAWKVALLDATNCCSEFGLASPPTPPLPPTSVTSCPQASGYTVKTDGNPDTSDTGAFDSALADCNARDYCIGFCWLLGPFGGIGYLASVDDFCLTTPGGSCTYMKVR